MRIRFAAGLAVFLFAFALCLHYGRQGFMPLDHSIVFDAGWRILSGQVPYRDFFTPIALVPGYMQAAFFAILGVNWFSFILHAAIVNGVFAVLVVALLRTCGAGWLAATLLGLASGVFFYTPLGAPFADQHAFFFVLVATWSALGPGPTPGVRVIAVGLAPVLVALAALSKQIPGLEGALPVAIAALWPRANLPYRRRVIAFSIGVLVVASCALWLGWFWSESETVRTYFWTLPLGEGERRGLSTEKIRTTLEDLDFLGKLKFTYVRYLPFAIAAALAWGLFRSLRRQNTSSSEPRAPRSEALLSATLAAALYALTVVFIIFTRNQTENGLAFLPLIIGLTAAAWRDLARPFRAAVHVLLLGSLALDGWAFHQKVNQTRYVNELAYDDRVADAAAGQLPPELSFLRWHPVGVDYTPQDLTTVAAFLKQADGNFLVLGDSVFLYGITGKPSVSPNLWFHPNLSVPMHAPLTDAYEAAFKRSLRRYRPRYLIIEGYRTRLGYVGMGLPFMKEWFRDHKCTDLDLTRTLRVLECAG